MEEKKVQSNEENTTPVKDVIIDNSIENLKNQIAEVEEKIKLANQRKEILQKELDDTIGNTLSLSASAINVSEDIASGMDVTQKQVQEINDYTVSLFHILDELTFSYFSLKNISAASKSVTEYSQIYNQKYSFYNELRRIALGYVVGIDSHIIHNSTLRVTVEKIALQNSSYWLTYCISAVMLWISDEKDAAGRAVQKAIDINYEKSSLFFLLINLRFNRIDASRMWFLKYLDRFDMTNVGNEWQYLLQAYLYNAFGKSINFQKQIDKYLSDIISRVKAVNVGFERKVSQKFKDYLVSYPHFTNREFTNLSRYCRDYPLLIEILTSAEKNYKLATYFTDVYGMQDDENRDLPRIIEDVLYDLINSYDDEEYEIFKKIKLNEAIVQAKGDITIATKNHEYLYENNQKVSLDELLLRWCIADKDNKINIRLRRLALDYLNESLVCGVNLFQEQYQQLKKKEYEIVIDECSIPYQIGYDDDAFKVLNKHYSKSFFWNVFDDKLIIFFLMLCLSTIACLCIVPFYFNIYALIISSALFVTFGLASILLILRQAKIFNGRKEKYIKQLKDTLKEFDNFNDYFNEEDNKSLVLKATIERFKNEEVTKDE